MTLTDFLLARIAEDEAVAREAIADDAGETGGMEDSFDQLTGRVDWFGEPVRPQYADPIAALIVRTAVPARVLAECEAKRRIVEYLERSRTSTVRNSAQAAETFALYEVAEILARVYADHPDYRDEWRP